MSATDLDGFFIHQVTVKRWQGVTGRGPSYAATTTPMGWVDDEQRLVRDADGNEVVSSTSVFLPATEANVPPKSLVTLPAVFGGGERPVLASSRAESGALDLPDHIELNLA